MAAVEARRASTASSEPPVTLLPAAGCLPAGARRSALPLFPAPALLLYGLFVLWPLGEVVWLSLHRWDGYGPQQWVGLANFTALWGDAVFRTSLEHTLLWLAGAWLIGLPLALALALLIASTRLPGGLLTVLAFPVLLPATVVAALATLVYSPVHGIDALLGAAGLGAWEHGWLGDSHLALGALFVAWLWSVTGLGTVLFWSGLRTIGAEYLELARVEGAGAWGRLRWILLPGLRPTTLVVALVYAALAFQVFDLVFVTTGGGPGYATLLLSIDVYGRAFGGQHTVGQAAAGACLQLLLSSLIGLAFIWQRGRGETLQSGEPGEGPSRRWSGPATLIAAGLVLVVALPLAWLPLAALQPDRAFALGRSSPLTLDNFGTVWTAGMGGAIVTSLLLAAAVTALVLVLATPTAFALSRLRPRRRLAVALLLLVGILQPTPVLIVPLFAELQAFHLLNSPLGIILPEAARSLPVAVLLLWGYLSGAPGEPLEAAAVDGAGPWQQLWRVALPLGRPALIVGAIWAFALSWNEYLLPVLVSQDGSLATVPTLLGSFIGVYNTQYGALAAGTLLALLPSLLIYLLLRREAAGRPPKVRPRT